MMPWLFHDRFHGINNPSEAARGAFFLGKLGDAQARATTIFEDCENLAVEVDWLEV